MRPSCLLLGLPLGAIPAVVPSVVPGPLTEAQVEVLARLWAQDRGASAERIAARFAVATGRLIAPTEADAGNPWPVPTAEELASIPSTAGSGRRGGVPRAFTTETPAPELAAEIDRRRGIIARAVRNGITMSAGNGHRFVRSRTVNPETSRVRHVSRRETA